MGCRPLQEGAADTVSAMCGATLRTSKHPVSTSTGYQDIVGGQRRQQV
jgi:hypothetical protein